MPNPTFFKDQYAFRQWLEENHQDAEELYVGFYKKGTGKENVTWSESVDQALCFGWIDGVRHKIDEERYCIRFTPRRIESNWSAVNLRKIEKLKKAGLMHLAGLDIFEKRKEDSSYSYEKRPERLSVEFEKQFKANNKAWVFFKELPPSYKRTAYHWIMSAKRENTQISRLEKMIQACEEQKRLW